MKYGADSLIAAARARILATGFCLGVILVAACSAPATQAPRPRCHIGQFMGDWVSVLHTGDGVTVSGDAVTMTADRTITKIAYVADRDFGLVTRQVLRQEFARLAALGSLPAARRGPDEMVCAIQLIRPQGAAALVADGRSEMVYLEETRTEDAPMTIRLHRGEPSPATH